MLGTLYFIYHLLFYNMLLLWPSITRFFFFSSFYVTKVFYIFFCTSTHLWGGGVGKNWVGGERREREIPINKSAPPAPCPSPNLPSPPPKIYSKVSILGGAGGMGVLRAGGGVWGGGGGAPTIGPPPHLFSLVENKLGV